MTMTVTEVRALPAIVDVVTAAEVLGIGRTVAYELVRTNRVPTPVVRVGRQIKIPTSAARTRCGSRAELDYLLSDRQAAAGQIDLGPGEPTASPRRRPPKVTRW